MAEVFTRTEAQAIQGHRLYATQDSTDEHGRVLIEYTALCKATGLDAWSAENAIIAVQFPYYGRDVEQYGIAPKVVLVNKTTYE